MSTHDDYQEHLTLARQFDLDIPVMQGQLTCAFVGEWSHGKSALLNSLIGLPLLPSGPTPTNKTIVRLSLGEAAEPVATVHADADAVRHYTGQAAIEALQGAREHLLGIDYRAANLDLPANTVFIDTPGLNDTDQMASSRAESVAADVVVFVINADVSAINQTQIEFIQQVLLAKADLSDLFFVFTHGDLVQDARDRDRLRERLGAEIGPDHIFFLSNKDQSGVQAFKQDFYAYLAERRGALLAHRQQRQTRRLLEALHRAVTLERAALAQYQSQTAEERLRLLAEIQAARVKESTKKSELRERARQRREDALREFRKLLAQGEEQIDTFIDASRPEQLRQPGYLKDKIDAIMVQQIQPAVRERLEAVLRTLQTDVEEGQTYSTALLANLDIQLPPHASPLSRVTAEHILPLAVLGSVAVFGWVTVPTLLLGFLTLKAR